MTEYHNATPVTAAPITPEPSDVNDILKDHGRFAGEAVDWLVSNFGDLLGFGDKGLYDYVVLPIAGDYSRIKANGQAWGDAGTMLGLVQQNLRRTATTLVTSDWTGAAATAFFGHIDVVLLGGLYVAEKCSGWMRKGFEKLSELSIKIARKCVQILDVIMKKITDLAAKLIPGFGQVWSIVEWVASGFDKAPYIGDVQEIVALVKEVLGLHKTLTDLVSAVDAYYQGFQQALDAVKAIPEVDSTAKAADIAKEFDDGREEMKKARADVDKNAAKTQKQLDDMGVPVDAATK
jgi:hypothetical protein